MPVRLQQAVSPFVRTGRGTRRRRQPQTPLSLERLEDRSLMAGLPYGALPNDTAEYMLGDVYVSVVLMESNGTGINNTENWTNPQIATVKSNITQGLAWWKETLGMAQGVNFNPDLLKFQIDFTRADNPVPTSLEPISRTSDAFSTWVIDFFNQPDVKSTLLAAGLSPSGPFSDNLKAYNNAQRLAHNADWAFTIFVVNDANDADHQFAFGGFPLAFTFSGGRAVISLASRPASTYAHEAGIIFYARDEYPGSGNYTDHRGYYDTQNLNAADGNPDPSSIVPSIMAAHAVAFPNPNLTGPNGRLAISTMEEVGWKDSDGDGIFDVLDVPHSLTGSGSFDAATSTYRFFGSSEVRTLPNKNPRNSAAVPYGSSLQSDVTINRLTRVQFRINGAPNAWQTAATFSDRPTSKSLSLNIPVPAGFQTIEIRTFDDRTGVASDIFVGTASGPAKSPAPGINGGVRHDADGNGVFAANELGLAGWTMRLVDASLQPLNLMQRLDPDDFPVDTLLNNPPGIPGVTLSAVGSGVANATVIDRNGDLHPTTNQPMASTGSRVFRFILAGTANSYSAAWHEDARLRVDFGPSVTTVSLDAVANTSGDVGRLEAFDASNNLLARYTTRALGLGQAETMTVSSAAGNIAYVIAKGQASTAVQLDNLSIGPLTSTTTDARGRYSLPNLPAGTYTVQAVPRSNAELTSASTQTVVVTAGSATTGVEFGGRLLPGAALLQNPADRFDVNDADGFDVRDVFNLISQFRILPIPAGGLSLLDFPPGAVPLPYIDINGDNFFDSRDAFAVINAFRSLGGGSSSGATGGGGSSGGGNGEGEAAATLPSLTALTEDTTLSSMSPGISAHSNVDAAAVTALFAQLGLDDIDESGTLWSRTRRRR